MDPDNSHDDLTALFEIEDGMLQSDDFVASVMNPIRKRAYLRQALLFGAGGIGVGAAISQLTGFMAETDIPLPSADLFATEVAARFTELPSLTPMFALSLGMALACLVAMAAFERA